MTEKVKINWFGLIVCLVLTVLSGAVFLQQLPSQKARPQLFEIDKPEDIVSAIKALSEAEVDNIRRQEAARFMESPLDSDALENMLLIANVRGEVVANEKLVKLAAGRSLRNYPAQFAAIQLSLVRKDYTDVMFRFDGLVRTQLEQRPDFFAMLSGLAKDEDASKALAKVLATSPPWRAEFMNLALGKLADPESAYRILANLKGTRAPPNAEELRVLINRLLVEKKADTAYFLWLDFLNEVELRKVKSIFDGGFELDPQRRFFDWTFDQAPNSQVGLVERSAGSSDRALKLQFVSAGSSGFYGNVQQTTRITPGSYTFRGQVKAQDLMTTGGLNWKLYCYGNNLLLMQSKPVVADTDWTGFEIPFEVPADDCSTQFLRLETAGTAALDMKVSGSIFFDDLSISSRDASQQDE
jgi:hypothetical protein